MRNAILAFAVLIVAGCGSNSHPTLDGGMDGGQDGPSGPADLLTAKTGCNGYVQCLNGCAMTAMSQADYDTCKTSTCDKQVTTAGKTKFNNALGCGQEWCLAFMDMGSGDCALSGNMLTDAPGKAAGACDKCLGDALAGLFGDTCSSPTAPNCNPAMCASDTTSCLNDTP
jgi:hypothetical protein